VHGFGGALAPRHILVDDAVERGPGGRGVVLTVTYTERVPAVHLRNVTAGYGDRVALADVNLAVPAGSLLAVIGPNGAGKSTLLKTIAGLLTPFSGTVEVFGAAP